MLLREDCVHFVYREKLYALQEVTGQPYIGHLRTINGTRDVLYVEIEYEQLPEQVRVWWKQFREAGALEQCATPR